MDICKLINHLGVSRTFPQALYDILENGNEWIQWNRDGDKFRYNDPDRLTQELQHLGFKARDSASLSKNFNDYQFKRLSDARKNRYSSSRTNWTVFAHPYFVRNKSYMLHLIRRRPTHRTRKPGKKSTSPMSSSEDSDW